GTLSIQKFPTNAPNIPSLPQLTWDPTTAEHWADFNSTNLYRLHYGDNWGGQDISYNFQLDSEELRIFKTNGCVVCERMGCPTFGDAYYRLFNADLPVFASCDSGLHAWYRSYQGM